MQRPAARLHAVVAPCQPSALAWIKAQIRQPSPPLNNNAPSGSSRAASASLDSPTWRRASNARTRHTGKLSKKIQRHPSHWVINPPSNGATVTDTPMHAPHTAQALVRAASVWNTCPITASAEVSSIAAPTPLAARASCNIRIDTDRPHASDARLKMPSPSSIMRRRPNRSDAKASMYALTIHSRSAKPACKARATEGKDTATMLVSSTINAHTPEQISKSVRSADCMIFPGKQFTGLPVKRRQQVFGRHESTQ